VLDVNGTKIMTDPGSFTTAQDSVTGISILIITHEHQDHYHAQSVAAIVKNNPDVEVVCNNSVAALIVKENIPCKVNVVTDGQSITLHDVLIEAFGTEHAIIYGEMGKCENTGYMVASKFYFPGDNLHAPGKAVDVLALPTAGPWMKMSEALEYAKLIKARIAFGVHDAIMVPGFRGFIAMAMKNVVPETEYVTLQDGESKDF